MARDPLANLIWGNPLSNSSKREYKRQPIAQSTKRAIEIKQKGKCALCGKFLVGSKHFDHIKEASKGGKSTTDNLRAICASCHDERHLLDKAKKMDKKKRAESIRRRESNQFGITPVSLKLPKFPY